MERVPFLQHAMRVEADARRPQHARCNTSPVAIVQIRLACLDDAGSPARLAYAALEAYYPEDSQGNLVYIDAPYNLTTSEESSEHLHAMNDALGVLDRYIRCSAGGEGHILITFFVLQV